MPTAVRTTSTVALAEAARRLQVAIRNAALADIVKLWPLLNFARIDQAWDPWLRLVVPVLQRRHAMSSDSAALFYRASRQHALGDPGLAAVLADLPTEEWIARAIGYAAPGVYSRQVGAGRSPEQANKAALTQTLGTTGRIVLDGARTTVADTAKADPKAVGWYFQTDGDPCHFCAIIASRGIVFHADSFVLSDVRFIGKGTAKVHNGCACILGAAFSRTQELPEVNRQALQVYKDRGDGDALNAFRKAWDTRSR